MHITFSNEFWTIEKSMDVTLLLISFLFYVLATLPLAFASKFAIGMVVITISYFDGFSYDFVTLTDRNQNIQSQRTVFNFSIFA